MIEELINKYKGGDFIAAVAIIECLSYKIKKLQERLFLELKCPKCREPLDENGSCQNCGSTFRFNQEGLLCLKNSS